jgi:hypothetical protein
MDRITAIRKSLTGFVCGLFGFLPVLGFVPALYALACWQAVRKGYRGQWNPASAYLSAGATLALLGLLGTCLVVLSAVVTFVLNVLD